MEDLKRSHLHTCTVLCRCVMVWVAITAVFPPAHLYSPCHGVGCYHFPPAHLYSLCHGVDCYHCRLPTCTPVQSLSWCGLLSLPTCTPVQSLVTVSWCGLLSLPSSRPFTWGAYRRPQSLSSSPRHTPIIKQLIFLLLLEIVTPIA